MSNLYTIGQMNEVADMAETVGFTPESFKKLSKRSVMEQVLGVLNGTHEIRAVVIKLLEFVGALTVAITEKFVAKDEFKVNTSPRAKVKISYLSRNFKSWFLTGDGKIEDPVGNMELRCTKLVRNSPDAPIIAELGGEAKAETTLSEMFALMAKQPNGEVGALLNNVWWNAFYIKDVNGVLSAVSVRWGGDGWDVYAFSVGGPDDWDAGSQVFSRNS